MLPAVAGPFPGHFTHLLLMSRADFLSATDGRSDSSSDAERPSKTRRKKDSHDLQALGEAVVALPPARLEGLPIDEGLRDAIEAYRNTRTHEGRRRQMQYIGKLMRRADPEPLRAAVLAMELGQARDALALHEAESWRAQLVASDDALPQWLAQHPGCDAQQLRSLIRAARKDAAAAPEQRSGRAFRELFRFVRAQQQANEAA